MNTVNNTLSRKVLVQSSLLSLYVSHYHFCPSLFSFFLPDENGQTGNRKLPRYSSSGHGMLMWDTKVVKAWGLAASSSMYYDGTFCCLLFVISHRLHSSLIHLFQIFPMESSFYYLFPQVSVWHWPKCWGLRNVNNRQKCTKINHRQSLNKKILSSSGRLLKIQKLFIILTILKEFFFQRPKSQCLQIKFKIYRQALNKNVHFARVR